MVWEPAVTPAHGYARLGQDVSRSLDGRPVVGGAYESASFSDGPEGGAPASEKERVTDHLPGMGEALHHQGHGGVEPLQQDRFTGGVSGRGQPDDVAAGKPEPPLGVNPNPPNEGV